MRSVAALTVAPPGVAGGPVRIERMVSAAPVAWRSTPDAVYLVGTAASPVGDDDVEVRVDVRPSAHLRVRSAAATVAWRSATGSRQRFCVAVGAGATVDWHPEPLIATAGCDHVQEARVELEATAGLRWVEEVVLGRHGEGPGDLDLRLVVDVGGRPLLRHGLRVGPRAPGWDGPAVLGDRRAMVVVVVAGPELPPVEPAAGPGWAVMPLDGAGALALAAGAGLAEARAALADAVRHRPDLGDPPACP